MAKRGKISPSAWLLGIVGALVFLAAGAAVGWAGATVFAPAKDVVNSTAFTTAKIVSGKVGSTLNVNATAEWSPQPVATNLAVGTVTSVSIGPGQDVKAGTALYSVNLRPVVIAQGEVPEFRSMSRGSQGADVAQLQDMLAALGFYRGARSGYFESSTQRGVEAWQKSLGVNRDGIVQAGDVVFVPSLPARVSLDTTKVMRGALLSGGEAVISALPEAPSFRIAVTDAQAALIRDGMRVEISGPAQQTWESYVVRQVPQQQNGTVDVFLTGKDGAPICGTECEKIPVTQQSQLPSRVVIVETVSGLTVPSAGLVSRADGSTAVIGKDGAEHRVTIVASAAGVSVITGVPAGLRVRVPAAGR